MPSIGVTHPQSAVLFALFFQDVIDFVRDHQCGDGKIARGQLLCASDHVRFNPVGLASPHVPGSAKAADHFVCHHEHIVFCENRLNFFEVSSGRGHHATRTHDGLCNERSDRFRAFA